MPKSTTLDDLERLNFHYYEQLFEKFFYILTVQSVYTRDQWRCVEADLIRRIFGIRGKTADLFVDATSSEP